jgi:hypothetical protein
MSASRFLAHPASGLVPVSVRQQRYRDKTQPAPVLGYPAPMQPDQGPAEAVRSELDRLVRRLREFSPSAWTPRRRDAVLAVLRELAALGDGFESRQVPDLPDHALADALAVIAGDALDAAERSADPQRLATVREALAIERIS